MTANIKDKAAIVGIANTEFSKNWAIRIATRPEAIAAALMTPA